MWVGGPPCVWGDITPTLCHLPLHFCMVDSCSCIVCEGLAYTKPQGVEEGRIGWPHPQGRFCKMTPAHRCILSYSRSIYGYSKEPSVVDCSAPQDLRQLARHLPSCHIPDHPKLHIETIINFSIIILTKTTKLS